MRVKHCVANMGQQVAAVATVGAQEVKSLADVCSVSQHVMAYLSCCQ